MCEIGKDLPLQEWNGSRFCDRHRMRRLTSETRIVASDVKEAGVANHHRMVWRIFGMALLCGIAIGLFIWGVLGEIFYVDGLFNSMIAFALGPVLLPGVFVGGFLLPIWLVLRDLRRCGIDTRGIRRGVIVLMIGSGLASWFGLGLTRLVPDPLSMFARGVTRYVKHRADIVAAQDWLSTLDPNDCQGQRLGREVPFGADVRNPAKCVPVPPSLAGLAHHSIALSKDNDGRPGGVWPAACGWSRSGSAAVRLRLG